MAQQIIIKGTPVVAANEVLVADSNSKIPAVDGSAVTAMAGGNITGTIPTARLDTGTTANKLVVLGGSGLPAVDGSLLTGIVSHTTSASDPTISTNPSGGVGSEWINSTSGKQFICTDATAGENVWKCSGGGSGDVAPFHGTGSSFGFEFGGGSNVTTITKYSFTSDGNAVDTTADLTVGTNEFAGCSSSTHGYGLGGAGSHSNVIDKFNMSTAANATDVGDLTAGRNRPNGNMSETYGYCCGGGEPTTLRIIDAFPFASDTNATDWGDLTQDVAFHSGHSSSTYGYSSGGGAPPSPAGVNIIDKFSFASTSNATDVGDLTETSGYNSGGQQSETYGYRSGGRVASPNVSSNVIDKWSFATDGNATDVGDLTVGRRVKSDSSSTTYGYTAAGYATSPSLGLTNIIDKHSFSADGNSTDVGDTVTDGSYAAGCQI